MSTEKVASLIDLPENASSYVGALNSFIGFLLKFSFIPILLAIGFGYHYYKKEKDKEDLYIANLTFVENNKLNSNTSSIPNLPSGVNAKEADGVIKGIVESDAVISQALFKPLSAQDEKMLINLYLEVYDPELVDSIYFKFPSLDSLTVKQKSYYSRVKNELIKRESDLFQFTFGDINSMKVMAIDEQLTYSLINNLYLALTDFYQQNTIESYNEVLNQLIVARDSTYGQLKYYQSRLISRPKYQGFDHLPKEEMIDETLAENIDLTKRQYTNLYSQVENMKMKNNTDKPIFRKLNYPITPLSKTTKNVFGQMIAGSLVGFVAGAFFVLLLYLFLLARQIYLKAKYT